MPSVSRPDFGTQRPPPTQRSCRGRYLGDLGVELRRHVGPLGILGFLLLFVVAEAETLTVATYNIENYVPADRMTEAGYRKDYPKPESEKQALRTVIRALNADILVLQEMGASAY